MVPEPWIGRLFLTSKVRLHCDIKTAQGMGMSADAFS